MTFTPTPVRRLVAISALLLALSHVKAEGYHYGPPSAPARPPPNSNSGHFFAPIPTIAPLPPVPTLPALPTGRPRVQNFLPAPPARTQTQTLLQVHPASSGAPRPAPPQQQLRPSGPYNGFAGNFGDRQPAQPQQAGGYHYGPPTGSAPSAPSAPGRFPPTGPLQPQPVRVPFGQQPIYKFGNDLGPDGDFYVVNGRQLKQYAVVEYVDNDISQDTKPFLSQSFVNNYRALVGASGTGAIAPLPSAMQLDSTADAILREQQRLEFRGATSRGDTIALGSGGIGFVRLPDGSVTLGSGSLNFVTGQQHLADLRDARTRSESQSDPLHFGHGPLEFTNNRFLFK